MPNVPSLEEIERCLRAHGYPCRIVSAGVVAVEVPTEVFVNRDGGGMLVVHVSLAEAGGFLVIDAPDAFELDHTPHREAALACLQAASAQTAVVKVHLDPVHGDVRFRVDCLVGEQGVSTGDVLRLVDLVAATADRWYPEIRAAIDDGKLTAGPSPLVLEQRKLRSLTRRAGGINRLEALWRIKRQPRPEQGAGPASN